MAASAPAATYTLYNYWRSSCSWRVRAALEWKGVPFVYKSVDLATIKSDAEFKAVNPNQRVPALVVDGHAISQSGAILEFLEEAHPEKPLLPTDLLQRAQVRNLCALVGCDIQPAQTFAIQAKAVEPLPESEQAAAKAEWVKFWIGRGLHVLESELAVSAGTYSVGDQVTLADIYLLPQLFNATAAGLDIAAFPTVARVAAALEKLPAFARSHPNAQPDAPKQ